jgi:hypothetical protein
VWGCFDCTPLAVAEDPYVHGRTAASALESLR